MADEVKATGPLGSDPGADVMPYGTDEPLLYGNGRFGASGYALPNPGGKLYCMNETVWAVVDMLGRGLFGVMHQEDRRFLKPLSKDILWEMWNLLNQAKKRISDVAVLPMQMEIRSEHATPVQKAFMLYPVPFFGDGCRNPDLRRYCSTVLSTITESMQHTEADKSDEVTWPGFGFMVTKHLWKVQFLMATKYFGYSRSDLYYPPTDAQFANQPRWDFDLKVDDWRNFDWTKAGVTYELTEERIDPGWVPTENDLRAIRGIPAPLAMPFAASYPTGSQPFFGGLQFGKPLGEKPTGSVGSAANTFPGGPPA